MITAIGQHEARAEASPTIFSCGVVEEEQIVSCLTIVPLTWARADS
jgi:hypothetical protein